MHCPRQRRRGHHHHRGLKLYASAKVDDESSVASATTTEYCRMKRFDPGSPASPSSRSWDRDDYDKDEFLAQQRRILEQIRLDCEYSSFEAKVPAAMALLPPPPAHRLASDDTSESFSSDLLHDEAFVREQRRLWATFRGGGESSRWDAADVAALALAPNESISLGSSQIEEDRKPPAIAEDLLDRKPAAKPPTQKFLVPSKRTEIAAFREDCTASLPNGATLRLKGTNHVYEALKRGTCAVVRCHRCRALLQVPQSSTAVYCPLCHRVTPMEVALGGAASTAASEDCSVRVGGGGSRVAAAAPPLPIPLPPRRQEIATANAPAPSSNASASTRKRRFARLVGRRGT